jgi:hypothetical protein
MHKLSIAFFSSLLLAFNAVAATPAAGDTYVYRVINAYNNEVRGEMNYRVDKVEADRVTMSVTASHPSLGASHTVVYAKDDNWLRHPLINHDMPVDYNFSPAYPAYMAPLDTGKSWSTRVNATNPASGRSNSVRVDADVLGSERITTPAGAFDTIKVKRVVYAGDWESFISETNIIETDWYAPALGRAVRTERNSSYMDPQKCGRPASACTGVRSDWHVFELVSINRK